MDRESIVLHNLDNDRIIGQHFVQRLCSTFDDPKYRHGVLVHASVPMDASSYGGIACTASAFCYVGGYDEQLPYPSGCQDTDLIKRLEGVGVQLVRVASEAQAGFGISNDAVSGSVWREHLKAKVGHSDSSSSSSSSSSGMSSSSTSSTSSRRTEEEEEKE